MLRFTLREAAHLLLGLLGAILMAAMIGALTVPAAWHGAETYGAAVLGQLSGFLRLDFGTSAISGVSVKDELARTLPVTLALATAGIVIALLIGVPIGILFGAGPARRAAAPLIQIVAAAPIFCASLALIALATRFQWPVAMAGGGGASLADLSATPEIAARALKVALLPALTVGLAGAATVQLALRRAAAESSRRPYRTGLRRMGLTALEIERVYVVPEVLSGLLASLGEITLALFAAAAVAEWVFESPGAAVLFVKSLALGDWTLAGAILAVFAAIKFGADFIGHVGARLVANPGGGA
jgi:peptide/nickel transport system permease protein